MKRTYLLSLALLVSCAPAVYGSSRVASVLSEDDTCDLVAYMCLGSVNPTNPLTKEVVERAKKVCMKRVACRHTPDSLRELHVDMPGLGDVCLIDADQASEMAYSVIRTMGDKNPYETAGKVYLREKLLTILRSAVKNLGECPFSGECKNHWVTQNGIVEATRYMLDKVVEQVCSKLSH